MNEKKYYWPDKTVMDKKKLWTYNTQNLKQQNSLEKIIRG